MNAEPGGGRILIASNRGPVSFTRGEDGNLTRHRGAGGLVSGLSTVAGRAHVLWVCAALSDADRAMPMLANWRPGFVDYLFLAFNTSTAFSPTDSLVLSRWAKIAMMVQATISFTTVVLLVGRVVNIL